MARPGPDHNIVFYCHHKGGSRFIRHELLPELARLNGYTLVKYDLSNLPTRLSYTNPDSLDIYGIPWLSLRGQRKTMLAISNASAVVRELVTLALGEDFLGVHVLRDPRSMLFSGLFHHRYTHPIESEVWSWPWLAEIRPQLARLNLKDGLELELNSIMGLIFDTQLHGWMPTENILEFQVESWRTNPESFLAELCGFLDLRPPASIEFNQFADSNAVDWRVHSRALAKSGFYDRYGELLPRFSYEQRGMARDVRMGS